VVWPTEIGRVSLREQIAHSLRAALVAGRMVPGVLYSVPTLAQQFGVSATPVREAMLDLAKEGLVEPVRNKGFRVHELTDAELDDITQLRAFLEIPALVDIARVVDASDADRLEPLAVAIQDAAKSGDLLAYVEADRQFHVELLGLLGNSRLVELVRSLRAQSRLYGLAELAASGKLVESAQEHFELLDYLRRRDAAAVEQLMRRHIGHVRGIWAARPEEQRRPAVR
jgi:DNA-binding GntR family transcriptional regulator